MQYIHFWQLESGVFAYNCFSGHGFFKCMSIEIGLIFLLGSNNEIYWSCGRGISQGETF